VLQATQAASPGKGVEKNSFSSNGTQGTWLCLEHSALLNQGSQCVKLWNGGAAFGSLLKKEWPGGRLCQTMKDCTKPIPLISRNANEFL